ncbi:MAG: DNA/RNA nuclease SfsA [Methanothermobacter wolfeii]|nr:DNA/RNA nuclease SfsA [Methanothermobacter wolfeii]
MKIDNIICGVYIDRPNRFTMVVDVDGEKKLAHLRDPGRLKELLIPGREVLLRKADGGGRKTEFDVIAVRRGHGWVLINSGFHSDLAAEIINSGLVEELEGFRIERREFSFGESRLDFLLSNGKPMLLEVKGCTLVVDGLALFPDAPTERGRRHVMELADALDDGYLGAVLFLVFGEDARVFSPNVDMDPDFASALREAYERGVMVMAYSFRTIYDGSVRVEPLGRIRVEIPEIQ